MPTPALYINEFTSGLYTQRSPLVTPTASMGLSTIVRNDVLADGLNMEMSNRSTLIRRFGFSRYCSTSMPNYPWNFHSHRKLDGTIFTLVDTQGEVNRFTTSTMINIFAKGVGAGRTRFQSVGNDVFMCNGVDMKRWNGSAVTAWGITAPSLAPTISMLSGSLSPIKGYKWCYTYRDDNAQHESTAAPFSANTLSQANKNFGLSGPMSADTRVTSIVIYRTLDGGTNYYKVGSVANNPAGGNWAFTDNFTDDALNNFILAPINHANDPPPTGASNIIFHMGRLWLAVGNALYFAAGPDTTVGSGVESYPPANKFTVPSAITALVSVSSGLLVFTASDCYIIRGNDTNSFYPQPYLLNFGVETQECVANDGDLVFVYTSRRQLFSINTNLEEIGFGIGDKLLANFNPSQTYLAIHRNGTDAALYISNGVDRYYRYQVNRDSWSPVAMVTGGIGVMKSMQVAAGDYRLFIGRSSGGATYVLYRDLTTNADDGTAYSCYGTLGTFVIAPLGQTVAIEAIAVERMPVGTDATVSILHNEVSGAFTDIPNPVNEPPLQNASTSIISKRHYLKAAQTPVPQQTRHMQVKVAFPAENVPTELLGFALMKP